MFCHCNPPTFNFPVSLGVCHRILTIFRVTENEKYVLIDCSEKYQPPNGPRSNASFTSSSTCSKALQNLHIWFYCLPWSVLQGNDNIWGSSSRIRLPIDYLVKIGRQLVIEINLHASHESLCIFMIQAGPWIYNF